VEVWQTSNLRPLRLGKEKKEERTNDRMKITLGDHKKHTSAIKRYKQSQ